MSSQKVYVIDTPQRTKPRRPRPKTGSTGGTTGNGKVAGGGWLRAFRAYMVGPVNVILWQRGRGRLGWVIVSVLSLAAALALWTQWSAFMAALEQVEHGPVIWAASVALVVLMTTAAWSRSIVASERSPNWPSPLRATGAVFVLGLFLPGLGYLIARRRWKAAAAIWCVGLVVAATIIVRHWQWMTAQGGSAEYGTVSQSIEVVLTVAAVTAALGCVAWLWQALDGVRAVSRATRSGTLANGLAAALLAALAVFVITFSPAPLARDFASTATMLRMQGLKSIPLALYEVASKLDPTTPEYLAEAAVLYEELGASEKAVAKQALLENRAAQFATAIGAELVTNVAHIKAGSSHYPMHYLPPHPRWKDPPP